ncbi:hypothetical protein MIN45_P0717 [Methylomarinovum tepidoasis]|uniref:PepSY domain-containing protein n=1 Tax=Methylomarinovum tepidoasis TaxID=2840183 RepID=A0AAU9BXY8_9GAMM|nr:PepSY-associated TM helix domain-containing protein [Methylomarinovum sp. IN45]BCX88348.1 hypothetical protein MIN45_P0717 [Methylomarinovum sp. IN45]
MAPAKPRRRKSHSHRWPITGRRWAFRLHRWLALGTALLLVLLGLSGSLLVYRDPLYRLLHPQTRIQIDGQPAPLGRLLDAAFTLYPPDSGVWRLVLPGRAGEPAKATYVSDDPFEGPEGEVIVWIDPYRAEVLRAFEKDRDWFEGWLYRFHSTWLLEEGKLLTAALGTVLVILIATGLSLWWPTRRRLHLNLAGSHRWLGALGSPLLLFSTLTGLYLAIPHAWLPALYPAVVSEPRPPVLEPADTAPLDIDTLVARIVRRHPRLELRALTPPRSETDPWLLEFHRQGSYDAPPSWDKLWVDPWRARIAGRIAPPPTWRETLLCWMFPLHSGAAIPPGTLPLLALTGLLPLPLAGTGLWLWLRHRIRKRHRALSARQNRH